MINYHVYFDFTSESSVLMPFSIFYLFCNLERTLNIQFKSQYDLDIKKYYELIQMRISINGKGIEFRLRTILFEIA